MAKGDRAKHFRGNHTHGRGKKAGRGAGLKGGRGRAGANKHRYLMLQVLGGKHAHLAAKPWGRVGFKSKNPSPEAVTVNVGELESKFPGKSEIDLGAAGFTKLLGSGSIGTKVAITVETASAGAIAKVQAAGGTVKVLREPEPPKAKAPEAKAGAPAKGGEAKPKADKPKADKPAGDKPKGDKAAGDKPKADKPKGDKPAGDKAKA